jgi:hypothetical protein
MAARDAPKTRRVGVMFSDSLIECLSATAESMDMTVSAFIRQAVERECERSQEQALSLAAEEIAPLYESDKELTAFLALDADDFA